MKAKFGVTKNGLAGVELQPENGDDQAMMRVFLGQVSAPGFRVACSTDHDRVDAITHLMLMPEAVAQKKDAPTLAKRSHKKKPAKRVVSKAKKATR